MNNKSSNMGSLYYMSGGWHSKNKYATGGTTLPYQMAPEYPEYEEQGYNYDTTKKVGQAGLAATKASGYNPYVAAGAAIATAGTFVYDIFKSKEENEAIYNRNQGVGEGVKETLAANSPYSKKGGYGQYNDSGIEAAKGGPIWHMLGKNPQQFQMDQNNNQFKRGGAIYAQGGGVDPENPGMTGMMKSKIATEAHYGNPSALRMVSPNPSIYTWTGEEKDWDGNQAAPAGNIGTHFMGSYGNEARPGLQEVDGKMQYFQNPPSNSKENFNFSRPEDAEYFAKNYKDVAPMMRNYDGHSKGGGVGDNQASGVVPGGPNDSTTEDNKVVSNVKNNSFVIPANKIDEIEPYLLQVGIDPNKKIASKNINANSSMSDEGIIHASKDEWVLAPDEVKLIEPLVGGPEGMERKFSPNSPHNIYAAMGGKMGNNYVLGGRPIDPPVFIPPNKKPPLLDPPDYTPPAIIPPDNTTPPPQRNFEDPAEDAKIASDEMTEEARRQNKTMLGINTAKAAGMGIWNALQKNPEMPKQGRFNPMLISSNTEAMGAEQNYLSAKAGATARRAATEGNINQTVSNASIQANTLAQQVTDANQRSAINQRVNEANVGTLNQASLYNLQADNQYNQMNAERTAAFKQNKATAISGNINDAAKGYNNYANANLGINALEKGYNSGKINQALYQKAMNNPESLTPEEIIQLNSITGGNFNPANLS
jgi:hypothetical protein